MSIDDDDDWDDSFKEDISQAIKVPKDSVILRTRHRKYTKAKDLTYMLYIYLGTDVFKKLKWTELTKLKFQWGKESKLGLLRIAVILNEAAGWTPTIYKNKYCTISNKSLPPTTDKIERENIELAYSIEKDSRSHMDLFYLELRLPSDFYQGGIQGNEATNREFQKCVILHETQPQATIIDTSNLLIPPQSPCTQVDISAFKASAQTLKIESPQATPESSGERNQKPVLELDREAFLKEGALADIKLKQKTDVPQKNASKILTTQSKPESKATSAYDRAIAEGGPISIDDLCRFVRVFSGDAATKTSNTIVEINDVNYTYQEALEYANRIRLRTRTPLFTLSR